MRQATRKCSIVLSLLLTFCFGADPGAFAAASAPESEDDSSIVWRLEGEAAGHQLVISGPGGIHRHDFAAGETPRFSVFGEGGNPLADGEYTWELRSIPVLSAEQRAAMERARAAGAPTLEKLPRGLRRWGYFVVDAGSFVSSGKEEVTDKPKQPVQRTQVINDNLRLSTNVVWIEFQDTSVAPFPSNDWRLSANDSASGGANRFSIDDLDGGTTPFNIEAGAPDHSLYVDDAGLLGVKTSTPLVEVHVVDGDTPTLRLEQDASLGFTAQTWDVGSNEVNFFVRDVTSGSRLPFRIKTGAPANALLVDNDGNLGVNEDTPGARVHITGDTTNNPDIYLESTNGATPKTWRVRNSPADGRLTLNEVGGNVSVGFATGAQNNLLRVGISGAGADQANTVSVGGNSPGENAAILDVYGSVRIAGVFHADYVFDAGYELPTIEDHAEFMWRESHLPSLPKAPEGNMGPVDIAAHQMGILEELETAHIYIEQLNGIVKDQKRMLEDQNHLIYDQSRMLKELQERMTSLESTQN